MSVPDDRQYLPTHEWHKAADGVVTIGITQLAADELTDITYVDLPEVGTEVTAGEAFGEVESVKATSDLYSAYSGTITEINESLNDDPSDVNTDPHEAAWMIKLEPTGDPEGLLDRDAYLKATGHD